jgi:hypothetical protein
MVNWIGIFKGKEMARELQVKQNERFAVVSLEEYDIMEWLA